MSYTFDVIDVEPQAVEINAEAFLDAAKQYLQSTGCYDTKASSIPGYIQKYGCAAKSIMPHKKHGVIQTAYLAYCYHFALSLAPDHLWSMVIQGLAQHIQQDPERYRDRLVAHEGKMRLVVQDDLARLDSMDNNWEGFVDAIAEQVGRHIGASNYARLLPRFSTTTPVDMLCHQIGLMNTVSHFFEYVELTLCAVPRVTLEGEPHDWARLLELIEILEDFDLVDWYVLLAETLEKFYEASCGVVDVDFWRSMVSEHGASGESFISGWIVNFLNYRNLNGQLVQITPEDRQVPITWRDIPTSVGCVPVIWEYIDQTIELELYAGCFGMSQAEDFTIRPELGWLLKRA